MSEHKTIRERVAEIRAIVKTGNLPPSRARELALELSALQGNVHKEVTDAQMAYNAAVVEAWKQVGTFAAARMVVDASDVARRYLEAKYTAKDVTGMKSTLSMVLRSLSDEVRGA